MHAFRLSLGVGLLGTLSLAAHPSASSDLWLGARPDSHGPAGVMADHVHAAGEWMFGYHFMYMDMSGLQAGTDSISALAVAEAGYSMAPESMQMYMHMFDFMYAPTDWLTLMLMPQHIRMDMDMVAVSEGHDHGGEGGHDDGHDETMGSHSHATEGWGDTGITALFKVWDAQRQRLQLGLGLSLPTGSSDERMNGRFVHYGMQLGSGTYDLKPSVTYLGQSDALSWGLQVAGTIRLEDANDSGFSFGDVYEASTWVAWLLHEAVSVSGRLAARHEGKLTGHYNGPHNHSSPPDLQRNYGGEVVEAGLGLNTRIPSGFLKGHRLGAEVLLPLYEDYNGIQLARDFTLAFAWTFSF